MSTNILVPLDGSTLAEHALPTALALAKKRHARLELAIVHETDPFDGLRDAPWNAMTESMRDRYVTDKAEELSRNDPAPVEHALLHGDVSEAICRHARALPADLIVMSTHGHTGITRALVGSVADGVIRESGVPVLVLRRPDGRESPDFHKILVLDDGSAASQQILKAAACLATPGSTTFTVLRVVVPCRPIPAPALSFGYLPPPIDTNATADAVREAQANVDRLALELTDRSGCEARGLVIVEGDVPSAIDDFAKRESVDLVAMTTHGRGASRLVFGSVSDRLLHSTATALLVLRPSA